MIGYLKKQKISSWFMVATLLLASVQLLFVSTVNASPITSAKDTMSRLKTSTLSNHEIIFVTPTGVESSSDTISVTFPGGFTMGSFAVANVDLAVGDSGTCTSATYTDKTLAASASSGTWGVAQSSQTITFTAPSDAAGGEITAGICVKIEIGSNATSGSAGSIQITNPGSTGTNQITIGGTFGDSGDMSVQIIADDQVSVTGTVNQTLSFSISDTSVGFGTLSSSAARYATGDTNGNASETEAHTLIVGTNASGGYGLTVNASQANPFRSGSNYIASSDTNVASSVGTQQFGLRATASGGSGAVTAPYAASGFALASSTFPTASQVASASGATSDTTYSVRYISNITSNTAAGIYTATLTYVATATY